MIPCSKSPDGRHNFAIPGRDCFNGCGVNQKELSSPTEPIQPSEFAKYEKIKVNHRIHSELHSIVDEIRNEYGENHIKKGAGSFGFYLGLLRGVPKHLIYQWRSELKQNQVKDPAKIFVWKARQFNSLQKTIKKVE